MGFTGVSSSKTSMSKLNNFSSMVGLIYSEGASFKKLIRYPLLIGI